MEVKKANRKKSLLLLTLIAMAMTVGGVAAATYAVTAGKASAFKDVGDIFSATAATLTVTGGEENGNGAAGRFMMSRGFGLRAEGLGNATGYACGPRMGLGRFIEVSEEFKTNVVNIAEKDTDVQKLLSDGYTDGDVRPLIKSQVDGNGDVITKATGAILTLQKDTTGRAKVWVDLTEGKVVRLVISTRTVIEKR